MVAVSARLIPDLVFPTEWSLLPKVCDAICEVFNRPHIDLFVMRASIKLPLMCLQFQIHGMEASKMPFSIPGMISVCVYMFASSLL